MIIPASTNLMEITPHRLVQKFVSVMILNPIKLPTKINHHSERDKQEEEEGGTT